MTVKFTEFNNANLSFLRDDINAELKALGEKYGITLHVGNARFSPTASTFKLEVAIDGEKTLKAARTENMLDLYGDLYIKNFDSKATYSFKGIGDFQFVGYNTRARKNPFEVKQLSSGKIYVLTTDQASMATKK